MNQLKLRHLVGFSIFQYPLEVDINISLTEYINLYENKKPNITEVVLRDGQQSLIATRMN